LIFNLQHGTGEESHIFSTLEVVKVVRAVHFETVPQSRSHDVSNARKSIKILKYILTNIRKIFGDLTQIIIGKL
jgi:hypothetical protein